MSKTLTLRQMEYLVALAEEGTHTGAARRAHVSQPTLTESIRDAERALGVAVFEKHSGITRVTAAGESVIEAARAALEASERVMSAAKWSEVLRVGAIDTIAPYLLPMTLQVLRKKEPNMKVAPTSGRTDALLRDVRSGKIDAVVLATPAPSGYVSVPLGRDEFKILTSSAVSGPVSMSGLKKAGVDMILLEDGHCLRAQAVNACKIATGGGAGGVIDGGSLDMVFEMVSSGLGATLVPQIAVQSAKQRPGLSVTEMPPEERAGRDVVIAWRAGHKREAELLKVSDVMKNQFKKLARI